LSSACYFVSGVAFGVALSLMTAEQGMHKCLLLINLRVFRVL
jgi:hypothetical protein